MHKQNAVALCYIIFTNDHNIGEPNVEVKFVFDCENQDQNDFFSGFSNSLSPAISVFNVKSPQPNIETGFKPVTTQ